VDPRSVPLMEYIRTTLLQRPTVDIQEDTPLLSSGLIDSFGFVDLLEQLQIVAGKRIDAGRTSPEDFETVQTMLALADRV
jgi:hypothetical protein